MTGWRCPVCGAGVAPSVLRCEHGNDQPPLSGAMPVYPPTIGGSWLGQMTTTLSYNPSCATVQSR